jgi:glycosyltransferase involved in cell wall biosynthesis
VAVSAPGCDEVIRDGETGLLTKSEMPALAEAAIGLLLDAERRRGMAVRARQIAEQEFDVDRQIERTLEVYAQARGAVARAGA